jgi:hypothetical protein
VTSFNDISSIQEYSLPPWSILEHYRIEKIQRFDQVSITYAETLTKFSHSNIVQVLRYFNANGTAYMVIPFFIIHLMIC